MYSPLGLVIFVAVERTFVCFTKGHNHLLWAGAITKTSPDRNSGNQNGNTSSRRMSAAITSKMALLYKYYLSINYANLGLKICKSRYNTRNSGQTAWLISCRILCDILTVNFEIARHFAWHYSHRPSYDMVLLGDYRTKHLFVAE